MSDNKKEKAGKATVPASPVQTIVRLFDSQLNRNYLICLACVLIAWAFEWYDSGFIKATVIFILAIPSGLFVGFGAMKWVEKGEKKNGM